jgi:choline dehydrogenase-like flavoprotein
MRLKNKYDYIVVGTGPGGATVDRELTKAKRDVLILEYGPRLDQTGFLRVAPKVFLDESKRAVQSDGS